MLTSVLDATNDAAMQLSQPVIPTNKKTRGVLTLAEYAKEVKDGIKRFIREVNKAIGGLTEEFQGSIECNREEPFSDQAQQKCVQGPYLNYSFQEVAEMLAQVRRLRNYHRLDS